MPSSNANRIISIGRYWDFLPFDNIEQMMNFLPEELRALIEDIREEDEREDEREKMILKKTILKKMILKRDDSNRF